MTLVIRTILDDGRIFVSHDDIVTFLKLIEHDAGELPVKNVIPGMLEAMNMAAEQHGKEHAIPIHDQEDAP